MSERTLLLSVRPWDLGLLRGQAPLPLPPPPEPPAQEAPAPCPVDVLELARQEADMLRAQAREEVQRLRDEAHAQGLARGLDEGRAQAQAEREALCASLHALLQQIPATWERFCLEQTPALTRLASAAAERIVHAQISLEPGRVAEIVRAALRQVSAPQPVTIRLHPDDIALIAVDELAAGWPTDFVHLEADPRLRRGGCTIEGRQGAIDATLDGAVSRLNETLGESPCP